MGRWNDRQNGGDDSITGSNRSEYIFGGDGDDTLTGLGGHDRIFGGDGNDALFGGSGNDKLFGGEGDDSIDGGEGCDVVDAGDGNDTINAGDHSDWVAAGDGDDAVDAGSGNDVVYGGNGNDTIDGGSGNDWLFGGAGDDVVRGGSGRDRIYGGSGDDLVDGGDDRDTVFGGSGDDTVIGGEGDDVVLGDSGDDQVDGGAGNDRAYGQDGNDQLTGGSGHDVLYGGDGDDTVDAGEGNDWVIGGDGNDVLDGGAGRDRIYGGDNNDLISGGEGADTIFADRGNDTVDGGAGNDFIFGGSGADSLSGGAGDDSVRGDRQDDTIDGGDGDDRLDGRSGDDQVNGGAGDDRIFGGHGDDTIRGDGDGFDDVAQPTELLRNTDGTYDISGLSAATMTVDFLGESAGYDNSFGFYLADASGNPIGGRIIFAEVDRADDDAGEGVRTISLDAADLAGASSLGFFLVPDGDDRNWRLHDGDEVTFQQNDDGEWVGFDNGRLIRSAEDRDAILFSNAALNRDGLDHEIDNGLPGNSAWEDLLGGGDNDFNDARFDIHAFDGEFPAFNDTIKAGKGDDVIDGDLGNDSIDGGKGDDIIRGGAGNDTIDADKDDDRVIHNASENQGASDIYDGGKGDDTLELELTQNEAAALADDLSDFQDFLDDNANPNSQNGPSFEFDGIGLTARNFEALNITIVNTNPDAVDDNVTTDEDTAVVINVLANDTDNEGDTLTITEVTQPTNGTTQIVGDQILYTPADDFNGTDSFSYTIFDGFDGFDTATVNITVNAVNDAPVAVNDTATVAEDTADNVINVLANDSDVDGDALTVVAASALNGTVTINGDNTISYTSDPNYHGPDTITYTISDGDLTATAEVAVTVLNDNADSLFTPGDDVVDFNNVTPFDYDDGNTTDAQGGNDFVILPTNQAEADEAGFETGGAFNGNDGDDTIIGGDLDDSIEGGAGNDSLTGGAGDDSLDGGEGDDTFAFMPGDGDDTITGSGGIDRVEFDLGDDGGQIRLNFTSINYGDSDDPSGDRIDFDGAGAVEEVDIQGGDGVDRVVRGTGPATDFDVTADLGAGDDDVELRDNNGQHDIDLGEGNDFARTGSGNDTIAGGDGDDSIESQSGDNQLFGGAGDDTATGGDGDDLIDGGVGNDSLTGDEGDDTIIGGEGDDAIADTGGTNAISGGIGDDTITVSDSAGTISGDEGNDRINVNDSTVAADGGDGDDFLGGVGGDNTLTGGAGNDTIDIAEMAGEVDAGEGDDTIIDTDGSAVLNGGSGDDRFELDASTGDVFGGEGDDFVQGFDLEGSVFGGLGDDTIDANGALSGGAGDDSITGGGGADSIDGDDGNDTLNGNAGDDVIDGGAGDDSIAGGDGNDTQNGGAGNDTLLGGAGDDEFVGGTGDDSINGGLGTDNATFSGNSDEYDVIFNGDGAVTIIDTVDGRDGTTTLEDVETATFNDGVFNTDGTNNAPEAVDDAAATDEDASVNIDVAANDIDFDSDELNAVSASADNGTVVVEADGTLTYTGNQDFNGTDTITYTVDDGRGGQDAGEVTVTVNAVNDAPVITVPTGGALRFDGNPANHVQVPHDPALSADSWTVEAWVTTSDDDGQFNRVVTKPVGGGQTYSLVVRDGEAHIRFDDATLGQQFVQAGFVADGEPHHIAGVYDAATDTLTLYVDGVETGSVSTAGATPVQSTEGLNIGRFSDGFGQGFTGDVSEVRVWSEARSAAEIADHFDQALDSATESNLELYMTFDVTVDAPGVVQDLSGRDFDGAINGSLSFAPGEAPVDQAIQTEAGTAVRIFGGAVDDVDLDEGTGQIQVTVEATNGTVDVSSGTGAVIAGDQSALVTITGTLAQVSASLSSMTFTPNAGFIGEETVTVTANDLGNSGAGGPLTDVQTFTVLVVEPNVAPVAADDAASVDEDNSVLIDVLANDTDDNGDDLTIIDVSDPANGTAVIENGQIRYTPDENFNGTDTISYTIDDGKGETDTAEVTVTVDPVNDVPVAVDDAATTDEDTAVNIDVLGNDSDVDGDSLTVTTARAENGTVVIEANGSLTYTGNQNFNGQDTISYTIDDGNGGTNTAEVTVTVNAVNDAPVVTVAASGSSLAVSGGSSGFVNGFSVASFQNSLTFEAIVRPDADHIFGHRTILEVGNDNPFFGLFGGQLELFPVLGGPTLEVGAFVHVAATFDGTTTRLYVDGSEVFTADVTPRFNTSTGLGIGFNEGDNPFEGLIDEVRIWSVVRTEAEIDATKGTSLSGNEAGLEGYWNFDNSDGTSFADLSGNGNDGVFRAGATLGSENAFAGTVSVDEDATLTINSISISDVDVAEGSGEVEAVLSVTNGTIDVTDTGATITGDGTDSVTVTGALADVNAAIGSVAYTGDQDFNGTDSLGIAVSDLGNTGAGGPLTDSESIQISVNAVNDAALIAGDTIGDVVEDGVLTTSGTLTVTDPDAGENQVQPQSDSAGSFGTFSVDMDGNWSYELDNNATAVDALACDETATDSFIVTSADGTASETVTITITGTNDLPRVSGPVEGGTTDEDAAPATVDLLASASDVEGDDLATVEVSVASDNAGRNVTFTVDNATGELTVDPAQFGDLNAGESETLTITYGVIEEDRAEADTLGGQTVPNSGGYYVFDFDTGAVAFEFNVPAPGNSFPGPANVPTNGVVFAMNPNNGNAAIFVSTFEDGVETLRPGSEQSVAGYAGSLTVGATSVSYNDAMSGAEITWAATLDDGCGPRDIEIVLSNVSRTDAFPGDLGVGGVSASAASQATPATATLVIEGADDVFFTAGDDVIDLNAAAGAPDDGNVNDALDGNDRVTLPGSLAQAATVGFVVGDVFEGGNGNDTLIGGALDDFISGGNDNDLIFAAAGADVVNGGSGNDTLLLSDGTDVAFGGTGDDSLNGGNDGDTLDGGAGADTLDGGAGVDVVSYFSATAGVGASLAAGVGVSGDANGDVYLNIENVVGSDFADTLAGDDDNNRLEGEGGADSLFGRSGEDTLLGGDGNDTVDGGAGNDNLEGGDGADSLLGVSGEDTLLGGSGDDTLDGGSGDDTLDGGDGIDTANYFGASTRALVNLGAGQALDGRFGFDTLIGIENVIGTAHDDVLTGSAGDNEIFGAGGDDRIDGRDGDDLLDGEGGVNTLSYTVTSGGGVNVNLLTGVVTGAAGNDTVANFHNIEGSNLADTLTGDGKTNGIFGGGGNDLLDGGSGFDSLFGGNGNDTLQDVLGGGLDSMFGGSGNDQLFGFGGADELFGGSGDDLLDGGDDADTLDGGTGNDTLVGGDSLDTLFGGDGDDLLEGGLQADLLIGGEGADSLFGGDNLDTADYSGDLAAVAINLTTGIGVDGSGGTDVLDSIERIDGSLFDDTINGSSSSDSLNGNDGNDTINGASGADVVSGGEGDDSLNGGSGNDSLFGGAGNDTLTSNSGIDTLNGGNGNDRIVSDGNDTIFGGAGDDNITGAGVASGGSGDDVIVGTNGRDNIDGGTGDDTISGGGGFFDILNGGDGNDLIAGGNDSDDISGGAGNDELQGFGGDDEILGDVGDDTLRGGGGDDRFEFAVGHGNDVIRDFAAGAGTDDVLSFGASINSTSDLTFGSNANGDATVGYGSGDLITLIGVNVGDLDADDFSF